MCSKAVPGGCSRACRPCLCVHGQALQPQLEGSKRALPPCPNAGKRALLFSRRALQTNHHGAWRTAQVSTSGSSRHGAALCLSLLCWRDCPCPFPCSPSPIHPQAPHNCPATVRRCRLQNGGDLGPFPAMASSRWKQKACLSVLYTRGVPAAQSGRLRSSTRHWERRLQGAGRELGSSDLAGGKCRVFLPRAG